MGIVRILTHWNFPDQYLQRCVGVNNYLKNVPEPAVDAASAARVDAVEPKEIDVMARRVWRSDVRVQRKSSSAEASTQGG